MPNTQPSTPPPSPRHAPASTPTSRADAHQTPHPQPLQSHPAAGAAPASASTHSTEASAIVQPEAPNPDAPLQIDVCLPLPSVCPPHLHAASYVATFREEKVNKIVPPARIPCHA
jgi:hypothetical protein